MTKNYEKKHFKWQQICDFANAFLKKSITKYCENFFLKIFLYHYI